MLKQIPKSDIIVRPLKVYKEWRLDENDISPILLKAEVLETMMRKLKKNHMDILK